jgi:hypothetical protein
MQELIRDCSLLENLLMFIGVCYQFYRGQAYSRFRALSEASGPLPAGAEAHELERFTAEPNALIDACCRLAYRLLREVTSSSSALNILYLSGINSMVRHISLGECPSSGCMSLMECHRSAPCRVSPLHVPISAGWDPPIEEILAAAIQDVGSPTIGLEAGPTGTAQQGRGAAEAGTPGPAGDDGTSRSVTKWSQYRLSLADLYQLVLELYSSYMKREISGTKILKLLANVCAPGNTVNAKVQTFLAGLILKIQPSSAGTPRSTPSVSSLLFSLRPSKKKKGWKVHLSLRQDRPVYLPDADEMATFSEGEKNMIKEAFARYDEDGSGAIDKEELGLLLQDLGMQVGVVLEFWPFSPHPCVCPR